MRTATVLAYCVAFSLICLPATRVQSAAPYCSLRDPAHQIFEMFPEATSYRSIVRVVDESARERVATLLPFTLHQRELGQHTLYMSLAGDKPMGIVHVRTEPGPWGLVEIAWALDLRLRVVDFRFQRCRGDGCRELQSEATKSRLRGLGFDQLRALLSDDTAELKDPALAPGYASLATTLVRSALKTIAVTQIVWGTEITPSHKP
jgi:hypothetical protein